MPKTGTQFSRFSAYQAEAANNAVFLSLKMPNAQNWVGIWHFGAQKGILLAALAGYAENLDQIFGILWLQMLHWLH